MDDEKLIILVQQNDILYNKFNKNYRLPDKKRSAWAQIAKEMGMPEEVCTKRWTSLRDRYAKEKKLEKLASGSASTFHHRWHYMQQLEFLAPHVASRPVRSTINVVEQHSTPESESASTSFSEVLECPFLDSQSQDSVLISPTMSLDPLPENVNKNKKKVNNKRRNEDCDEIFVEAVETFKNFCKASEEKKKKKENDPVYAFGKMVTATLNSLSDSKQTKAIQLITDVLMKLKSEPE